MSPSFALRKSRLAATLALGVAVALGTSGCAMVSTQATTIPYSPADGVNVPDSGPVLVRNALFVADESGKDANFIAVFINETDELQTLNLEFGDSGLKKSVKIRAGETVSLGIDKDPILVEGLDSKPGSDVDVYFQSGDSEGVSVAVPVLGGELDYLAPFVP